MKRRFLCLLLLAMTGVSCRLPERAHTFLPPTNIQQLCQSDRRFFYSPAFEICFEYPSSPEWSDVEVSELKSLPGTSISAYDFFLTRNNQPEPVFTLYITGGDAYRLKEFTDMDITVVHHQKPYLIGIITHEQDKEIRQALQSIQVFAKPADQE